MKTFAINNEIKIKGCEHFAPVFTPGVGQKELHENQDLIEASEYLCAIGESGDKALEFLYQRYPKEMLDEMVAAIRKHKPNVSDTQLAITIHSHLI